MEHEQSVADVLNSIVKANLSSAASREEWNSVVSDYFCQPSSDTDSCSSDEEQESLQEEEDFELPSVTVDPVREFERNSSLIVSDCQDEEMTKIARYKCTCQYAAGSPCYTQFSLAEIFQCRLEMTELTPDEKDMMLLGIISCVTDTSSTTHRSKKAKDDSHARQRQRSYYMKNGKKICRDAFMFLYSISKDKLTALSKWYKEHGLSTRKKKSGGRKCNTLSLELDDIKRVVTFISNYAEKNAISLPGRVATQFRSNVQLLPTSTTKSEVCRLYAESIKETGYRTVGEVTFCRLWHQLLPNVVISRPMTDLCWTMDMSATLPRNCKF